MSIEVTYFPDLQQPSSCSPVPIENVFNAIREGGDFIDIVKKCRTKGLTRSAVNEIKKRLPGIGFSGIFSNRSIEGLIESNGLMCLDWDKTLETPKELQPYILAKFLSPTATGVKTIIKIPLVKNDVQYKQYFSAIQQAFPSVDGSGKDISRLTYMSWDPDIFINENSKIWDKKIESAPIKSAPSQKQGPQLGMHKVQTNYSKLTIGLKMVQQASVGNRHDSILKAGRLMGGYISGGEVKEEDVLKIFENEVMSQMDAPSDFKAQWDTFRDGIKYGKALPLKDRERERKSIKAEFRAEDVYGDIYYTLADVEERIEEKYKNGNIRGVSTGWNKFDEYYSIAPGFFTLIYANPYTGKTKFELSILVNTSKLHGHRHLIFSPETGGPDDVYTQLIQIYAGGDLTDAYHNKISRIKLDEAKKFVNEHFLVIDSEIEGADLTIEDFLIYVQILERKFNIKFNTITADPLIEFKFDGDVRDDIFWNRQLKIVRVQAKLNNWHIFLVTHTIKQFRIGIDEFGNAVYPIPTPGEIAGGQTFWRKGYQILCLYRHAFEGRDNDMVILKQLGNMECYWNTTYVIVFKSKPEGMGKPGRVHFRYEPRLHKFDDGTNTEVKQADLFPQQFVSRLPYAEKDDLPDFHAPKTNGWAEKDSELPF